MTKPKADDIKKEVEEQDEEVYGETGVGGHMQGTDTDDDAGETLKKVVGEDLDEDAPLDIAKEVEEDEKERRGK